MNQAQEHLRREGRACYKRGEYSQALDAFTRALGRAPSVSLLDNRAACYEKLNDLPAALKDAKKAIQLSKEDPTGYLRAGKLLVKMEKSSVALEIYTHGLRNVKHTGQGYELLCKAQNQLRSQLAPARSVDPLTVLPRELAEIILHHLTFQQRINACLVSPQWAKFIRSSSDLWRHLDLTASRRRVSTKFISRAINVAKQKLTSASLNNLYDFDKTLAALVKHCPIESLSLHNVGLLSDGLLPMLKPAARLKRLQLNKGVQIGHQVFARLVLQHAATLEDLDCSDLHMPQIRWLEGRYERLTILSMRAGRLFATTAGGDFHSELGVLMPHLRSLTLLETEASTSIHTILNLSSLKHLNHLDLEIISSRNYHIQFPTSITFLRLASPLANWLPMKIDKDEEASHAAYYLPKLKHLALDLSLDKIQLLLFCLLYPPPSLRISEPADASLEPHQPILPLESLDITLESPDHLTNPQVYPNLRHLIHLTYRHSITEQAAIIVDSFPHIQTLDLSESDVNGHDVKVLLQLKDLRHLILDDCRFLGRDAVDWARSQGVRVDARDSAASDVAGKKVRYG
ncbi:hypothetical protein LTR62_006592 [Meristemomyces frigidus]|uniref:F-box domain-containing protein n=1 Tax=Meristemomyces frigidus TaxID=1508187 RepID=A0AAN7TG46_9PEZI|nr:hypothetical protein LTR62_006592 [Meristemomyces frigidus]